ncbi:MAG: type II toxin-antitoxin system HigB family toxin [Bacteroidota bacterium]
MDIVKRTLIREFLEQNPSSETALALWHKLVCHGSWMSFEQLRKTFPTAEKSRQFTVFSVGGGSIFIVTYIDYRRGKLFVREVYDQQHLERRTQNLSRTRG